MNLATIGRNEWAGEHLKQVDMQFQFKIHQGRDGFWADCIELKGCRTQADTRENWRPTQKKRWICF